MLCRGCEGSCFSPPTKERPLNLQCWRCAGTGKVSRIVEGQKQEKQDCKACNGVGRVPICQCPQQEIGSLTRKINLVTHAMNGLLPDAGGVNDQDAWFVDLWQRFKADVNLCEREKLKK